VAAKKSQPSLTKRKAAVIEPYFQHLLFDSHGLVPFRPQTDAIPVDPDKGKYEVGDMRILLIPVPNVPARALALVTDSLVLLKQDAKQWAERHEDDPVSFSLESWTCATCSVTFRSTEDKGVIQATYSRSAGHLELSMPCRSSWPDYGLGWLLSGDRCCAREAHNPTPWLGKQCGCE